jgi:adenylate cyclase
MFFILLQKWADETSVEINIYIIEGKRIIIGVYRKITTNN